MYVTLSGEFDLACEEQFTEATAELGSGFTELVIDLQNLEFIGSSGVRLVLIEEMRALGAGTDFSALLGEGPARRVFGRLGLESDPYRREQPNF